jgi:hypothetical protein
MYKQEIIEQNRSYTVVKIPVDAVDSYMRAWHPAGYGTTVQETTKDGFAIIWRANSCD